MDSQPVHKKQKRDSQSPVGTRPTEQTSEGINFVDLPVDALLEIFIYLHPLDLVHLCRVSVGLRILLASPNTHFIWRESYDNIVEPFSKPPPCPPGRNIAAYTTFVFCRTCNLCGANHENPVNTHHPGPMLAVCCSASDSCPSVVEKYLEYDYRVWNRIGTCEVDPAYSLVNWFPPVLEAYTWTARCSRDEYEKISKDLLACSSEQEKLDKIQHYSAKRDQNLQHYRALVTFFWRQQNIQTDYSAMISKRGWEILSELIKREGYEITQGLTSTKILQWMDFNFYMNVGGWPPNLTIDQVSIIPVWDRVRPRVIWNLEQDNLEKYETELMDAITRRIESFTLTLKETLGKTRNRGIEPMLMDFVTSSPFQEVIRDVLEPGDTDVTTELKSLMAHVPQFINEWRKRSEDFLRNLVSEALPAGEDRDDTVLLHLATTFFNCHWCHELLAFPRVLAHKCLRTRYIAKEEEHHSASIKPDDEEATIRTISDRQMLLDFLWRNLVEWYAGARCWNTYGNQVTLHNEASRCAKEVIETMGYDPKTATAEFMDSLDERVECLTCTKASKVKLRKRLIMTWRAALIHDQEKHVQEGSTSSEWGSVSPEDTEIAMEFESKNKMAAAWSPGIYTCKHCNEDVAKNDSSQHLLDQHDTKWKASKAGPRKRDYTISVDNRMKRPPYLVRI